MKKNNVLFFISLCSAILMSLSACDTAGVSENLDVDTTSPISSPVSGTENSEETDSEKSKIPEGAPELVLLDGNKASDNEIVKCTESDGDSYLYEVNTVFAYPYGTINADKQIGNSSSISKLSEGSKWGDFTVTKAEAAYYLPTDVPGSVRCQYLWLKGDISFKCKAYYDNAPFENNDRIVIELPDEISKQLPSLSPYANHYEDDEVDDCLCFMTYPEDGDFGRAIAEKLETEDDVEVTVSADEIKIQYTYFGLQTDGGTWGSLENVINFEIK